MGLFAGGGEEEGGDGVLGDRMLCEKARPWWGLAFFGGYLVRLSSLFV